MTRVAIASASDISDPRAFSGTPHGLASGLRASGCEVVGVSALLPERLAQTLGWSGVARRMTFSDLRPSRARSGVRHAQSRLAADRVLRRARSYQAARSLRALGPIDAFIQWGTDFDLPQGVPYVTFDDQTIMQAARAFPYPWIQALTTRERDSLISSQRRVFENAIACCVTTEWAAESLRKDYGIDPHRVRVVGIGGKVHPAVSVSDREWGRPRFLFVGLAWERKNGPALLRAFSDIRAAHSNAELHLVGGHPPVSEAGVFGHGRLDPSDDVQMQHLGRLYAESTCFILPSLHEPSAVSYVEALASGIGSIGTTAGGSATLIGDAGIMVRPDDVSQIANAMERFCDPRFAVEMGNRAIERSRLLTWQSVAARLLAAAQGRPDTHDLRMPDTK